MSRRRNPPAGASTPDGGLDEGPLQAVVGYRLAQASVVTNAVFATQVAAVHGLRKVEYTVLALVARNEGITASQIAAALAFTPPNTAAWLERLSQRGLIEREPHAHDRRALRIRLTAAGHDLVERATAAVLQGEAQALAHLTPGERLMLHELLRKAATRPPAHAQVPAAGVPRRTFGDHDAQDRPVPRR